MLELRVLGPIEAHDGDVIVDLDSRAQRAVLAALVQARGHVVATDELVAMVWDAGPPRDPRGALKSHVSRLRRALGEDVIDAQTPGYALRVKRARLDVDRFERELATPTTIAGLDAALALWRGTPYGEFAEHRWFIGEVARLRELHLQARLRRADLLLSQDPHGATASYTQLVAEHPLREAAWIGLLQALCAGDRRAEATAAARRYRELARDSGLDPSARYLEVEREVFVGPAVPTGGVRVGAPATTRTPIGSPASLPASLTELVGRERALADLQRRLADRRLVSLVGPGGVGKTSLATHAARARTGDGADGIWLVPLAEVEHPDAVVAAIVRAVGAPATEPLGRALVQYLAGRDALLVLDNAEHLLDAVREVVTRLLGSAEHLRILLTSRQPLQLPGEAVVPVAPLGRVAAVRLLRERARDAGADVHRDQTRLAVELCDRVDRLPLAIEMAAARLRGLDLTTLSERLAGSMTLLRSGTRGRHETLTEVVAWSYELLEPSHRSLLEQLSLFTGPFDLDAAESVADVADVTGGVLDLLDRSLLRRVEGEGPARFQLYTAVRSFAADRLAASSTQRGATARFVRYHAELARRLGLGIQGPNETVWAAVIEAQIPNLEAAHRLALSTDDVDAAVELATSLYVFVYHRLRADIGSWAEATLPVARRAGHPGLPAVAAMAALNRLNRGDFDGVEGLLTDLPDDPVARHAHEVLGDLHTYRGELEAGAHHFARAEQLARQVGDLYTVLHSRMGQAMVLGYAGNGDAGLAQVAEVRREGAEAGIDVVAAWCDFTTAELLAEREPDRALTLIDGMVDRADEAGWRFCAGVGRLTASSLRARTADPEDAIPGFERLIRHWVDLGDETHQWTTLRNLVELFVRLGSFEPAARLLGAVDTAPRPTFGPELERLEGARARIRAALGETADTLMRSGGRDGLASSVEHALAGLAALRGASTDDPPTAEA